VARGLRPLQFVHLRSQTSLARGTEDMEPGHSPGYRSPAVSYHPNDKILQSQVPTLESPMVKATSLSRHHSAQVDEVRTAPARILDSTRLQLYQANAARPCRRRRASGP